MSFENIQLPPFLLQDLYKNFLIAEKTDIIFAQPLENTEIEVLGSNKKNILVLLIEQSKTIIDKKDLDFLEGILKACNLTTEDISVVNIQSLSEADYSDLAKKFKPEKVLLFGVEPSQIKLPLVFPHNQIQQYSSAYYASFPSLKTIAAERPLKQALWVTLQKLFNLS